MATTGEPRQGFFAKLPRLGKCCACIEVRTGTIIIAVLGIVGCLLWFAFALYVLLVVYPKQHDDPELQLTEAGIYSEIIIALVWLGFTIMLLIGAIKRKPVLLKIYIILGLIGITLIILGSFIISYNIFATNLSIQKKVFHVFKQVSGSIVATYFVLCINSYLQQLLEEQQPVAPENVRFKPV